MQPIGEEGFDEMLMAADGLVLIDFWADFEKFRGFRRDPKIDVLNMNRVFWGSKSLCKRISIFEAFWKGL